VSQESDWTGVLSRAYGILLYAYPKEFREEFGAEMRQIFRDRWRAASATPRLAPRLRCIGVIALDWVLSSIKERMAGMRTTRSVRRLGWVALTAVACLFAGATFLRAYVIPSSSMEGSLKAGDHVLVNQLGRNAVIQRGDLIIFRYPEDRSITFVKRVIGLPGDRIRLAGKQVIRNGRRLVEPYAEHRLPGIDPYRDNFPAAAPEAVTPHGHDMLAHAVIGGELVVPAGSLFVLGDNRDNSFDSRHWGLVARADVIGKPLLVYWSFEAAPNPQGWLDVARHFFTRTRWDRTLHRLDSAPPKEEKP